MSGVEIRVGLLAYGAIGDEHNNAVAATSGLKLAAVCDTKPERLAAALKISPNAKTFTEANEMLSSGEIDLVVVSTPPNSHFDWAKKALTLNLHVVLEKPMALTTAECDELIALSQKMDKLLVVYQNRRYDLDFLTIKKLIESDAIGDVFLFESFVGGYSKPCSYWHSDKEVSGGAIFDWGSHFIDQILAIISTPVEFVTGLNQKRVWDHVTNADHAQVTINFAKGSQAVFINSDLAAVRKPKYFVLGTKGGITGDWDKAAGDSVADLPAIITLHHSDGTSEVIKPEQTQNYAFHKSLIDYLQNKTPMTVQAKQSRNVVSIMQAAEESALENGKPVIPNILK